MLNHGARELFTTPARADPAWTDVLKALAYGARAMLVWRPILLGLAISREAGVKYVLEMLRQEFDLAVALSGCPRLSAMTRDLVRPL